MSIIHVESLIFHFSSFRTYLQSYAFLVHGRGKRMYDLIYKVFFSTIPYDDAMTDHNHFQI